MGFLDKAKDKIDSLSDEVVRVMETNDEEKEKEEKPKKEKLPKEKKPKKDFNFPKFKKLSSEDKEEQPEKSSNKKIPLADDLLFKDEPIIEENPFEDNAFDLEEDFNDDFLQSKQEDFEAGKEKYSDIEAPKVLDNNEIQDILDFLKIPADVEIPADVYMVDDLDKIELTQQAPIGYDFGEVDTFVNNVKNSIKTYQEILGDRNKDIATLATTIDKLQIDLNNTKVDLQVANGLSIMPTNQSEAIENELVNEKIKNRNLIEKIQKFEKSGKEETTSEETDNFINALQDELALTKRKIEELEAKNYELITKVQYAEENQDYERPDQEMDDNFFNMDNQENSDDFMEIVLPTFDEIKKEPQQDTDPNQDNVFSGFLNNENDNQNLNEEQEGFSFPDDEESMVDFLEEPQDNTPQYSHNTDDEEDELDRIMSSWNN